VTIYSSLDEPLFYYIRRRKNKCFNAQYGYAGNEPIQHLLITKALKKRTGKNIEKKITIEQSALSQGNWFKRNLQQTSE
jgi:hypothetical protein